MALELDDREADVDEVAEDGRQRLAGRLLAFGRVQREYPAARRTIFSRRATVSMEETRRTPRYARHRAAETAGELW